MKVQSYIITLVFSLFSLMACNDKNLSWAEYKEWVSKEKNGIIKIREGRNSTLKAMYLPSAYLAYNESLTVNSAPNPQWIDSISNSYDELVNFRVELEQNGASGNMLWQGIQSYNQYSDRITYLNFHMGDFITLTSDSENNIQPIIGHFEGYNELSKKIVFHVSFKKQEIEKDIKLTFEDPFWGLGTIHFLFKGSDLSSIPNLIV